MQDNLFLQLSPGGKQIGTESHLTVIHTLAFLSLLLITMI